MLSLPPLTVVPTMLALLLLRTLASAGPAGEGQPPTPPAISVALERVGGSGVRGLATIGPDQEGARRVTFTLEAEGLQPGATYPVHLHAGGPAQPSAGFGLLGELAADAAGRGRLRTATMTASAGGAPVDLSLELLADGNHFLEIHAPGMTTLAVGEIPPLTAAASSGAPGPTGIGGVDAAIGEVLAGDADRLAERVRPRELPCGPDTPEGFAMAPPCGPGEVAGTPVANLPAAACEVYWPRGLAGSNTEHAGRPGHLAGALCFTNARS